MARTRPAGVDNPPTDRPPVSLPPTDDAASYTVVARRYRPQRFEDVVGQDHVVQALRNAIRMNRVTHAYLFSGTRGVGKTSLARIFAKCLNCVQGPTDSPCNQCDICRAISAGQDVDVIEIDGASNNGVEQVRELRQNAGLRPSRARYKIYYIDEVHMLSTGAFNALLKTLEEPPEHVKFFFATTEPNKIPITVLSRCQRFDFAGIAPEQIIESLAGICAKEGIEADRDALQAVARRAGGSMRDAQSLLEQLLSFGGKRLTSELVHQALGIAPDDRVLDLLDALADRESGRALQIFDQSVGSGVQPVDLLNGLVEFLRDAMVVAAGAEVDTLAAAPGQRPRLRAVVDRWPLDTILAALQILSEARARMRGSPHGRILVELALCRVARLEDFTELSVLLERLDGAGDGAAAPTPPSKKKLTDPAPEPVPPVPTASSAPAPSRLSATPEPVPPPPVRPSTETRAAEATPKQVTGLVLESELPRLELDTVLRAWADLPARVGAALGTKLSQVRPSSVNPPDEVVVALPSRYNYVAEACDTPEARSRILRELSRAVGRSVRLTFTPAPEPAEGPAAIAVSTAERADELAGDPLVQKVSELFEARRVRIDFEEEPPPA